MVRSTVSRPHRTQRKRRGLFRRSPGVVADLRQDEPGTETEALQAPEAETPGEVEVEVVEHLTPAQLNPDPVFAAFARTAINAMNRDTPPGQALLDMRRHLTELESRLTQARRQARNRVQAQDLADALEAADKAGAIPAPGTEAFDRMAAQGAATMRRRARHVVDDAEQTGVIPVLRPDDVLPPPAASVTGRVADGAQVHRQHPQMELAFPACVVDAEARRELLVSVRDHSVVYLPTQRPVSCSACEASDGEPAAVGAAEPVELSVVPASARQFPPLSAPASPVHEEGDGTAAPVPDGEPQAAPEQLPRRQPRRAPDHEGAQRADAGAEPDTDGEVR